MTVQQMQQAYHEVIRGGIDKYVTEHQQNLDEKNHVSRVALNTMFDKLSLWKEIPSGGHKTYKHVLTGIVVGYQNHGSSEINAGHATELQRELQKHMNILGNEIFKYRHNNWKTEPDYAQAVKNYAEWKRNRRHGGASA